jgi:dipeptidyl aminopeptidase/acylaminoacyl peptidase
MTSEGSLRGGEACCGLEHQRPSWYYANPRDPSVVYQTREQGRHWDIGISSEALSGVLTSNPVDEVSPIVSPNNQLIAFRTRFDNQWQLALYLINDWISSDVRLLTPDGMDVGALAWSPDSQHIAFERNGEIYMVAVAGSLPPINLTLSAAYESSPAWSPAGSQIAYVSNWEIYVMDAADGSNPHNLSQNPAYDVSPAWSPDAQQIAFASFRDENWEIYVMNSDGCNPRRLTDDEGWDGLPQWQPQSNISLTSVTERAPTAIVTTPNANLRSGPGETYAVIASAAQRECLTLVGRNADGTWLHIQQGETSAWVSSSIVEIVGDINRVAVVETP